MGGGVSAPKATFAPDPEYSEEGRKAKLPRDLRADADCWCRMVIHETFAYRTNPGIRAGRRSASKRVKEWKFEPAMKDGKPVAVQINVEVDFRLY